MRYVANASNHRAILNSSRMMSMVKSKAERIAAQYAATTKKRTGANAARVKSYVKANSSKYGDRAGGFVETWGHYNLQRELGGRYNSKPEMTLIRALSAVGGDVNIHVTPGRYVPDGVARSYRKQDKG